MKKFLLIISIFCFSTNIQGQQFLFKMNFVDSIGNKDSLILGYDTNGSDSIDVIFDETNIISVPLNSEFDVRISNEWYNRTFKSKAGTYQTKKQIIKNNCESWFSIQTIDIHTKHWPVTASWNSSLFSDSSRNGSVFTSITPGGWWDTGSSSDLERTELLINNTATFTSNFDGNFNNNYAYINDSKDTIPVFWQAFGNSLLIALSINDPKEDKQQLILFPNPIKDQLSFQIPQKFGKVKSIEVFSSLGQLLLTTNIQTNIDISLFEKGLYLVIVSNDKGEQLIKHALKE